MMSDDRRRLVGALRNAVRQVNFHVLADAAVQSVVLTIAEEFGISDEELGIKRATKAGEQADKGHGYAGIAEATLGRKT